MSSCCCATLGLQAFQSSPDFRKLSADVASVIPAWISADNIPEEIVDQVDLHARWIQELRGLLGRELLNLGNETSQVARPHPRLFEGIPP